jgi:dUTP pyrophosphatase
MEFGRDLKIFLKKLHTAAKIPKYAFELDACCDLYSIKQVTLAPMERQLVGTGVAIHIPDGFEGQIRARSGLAKDYGLTLVNGVCTIDSTYRGELQVLMINLGDEKVTLKKGDRIAQMKFAPVYRGHFIEVDDLSATARGAGGFGHTGV